MNKVQNVEVSDTTIDAIITNSWSPKNVTWKNLKD